MQKVDHKRAGTSERGISVGREKTASVDVLLQHKMDVVVGVVRNGCINSRRKGFSLKIKKSVVL
jgi:hypothetical protein